MTSPGIRLSGRANYGAAPVFGPITFTALGGCWTCLLGSSGVGKSTLLRLLAGLDSGVKFDGDISCDDGLPLSSRTALMLQTDMLLPWLTVQRNVTLGATLRGERRDLLRATELLARVGLAGFETRMPHTLSGGQRQRVALARTLMEDRPVVLLDEPFSALDASNRVLMQELAVQLFDGRTVVLVTHDPYEAARLGSRVVVMSASGLEDVPMPPIPVIRPSDAPEVVGFASRLLKRLQNESEVAA